MNKLSEETSPYLLQHQHNPVHWQAWGKGALEKAKNEDKVILLSIGYSACHWCHVMEHESFENPAIAQIMNDYYVCIKVDREERPDLDAIYMDALQTMGLRGGWPLNVFLMPDTKPFYGGTYFPPKNWTNLLYSIQEAFLNNRMELQNSAEGFSTTLNQPLNHKIAFSENLSPAFFTKSEQIGLFHSLSSDFDTQNGGLQRSPKFPMPSVWRFLLSYCYANPSDLKALEQLKLTLDRVVLGGIFDHVGGGWTRYATDEIWKVPHFEKMLYDNGQLLTLYAKTYQYFKNLNIYPNSQSLYAWAISKTLGWLKNEMANSNGGFYAALDADSEGEEGAYYVWKKEEIDKILGQDAAWFCEIYNISEEGNWEGGLNILHLESILENSQIPKWEKCLERLEQHRITRVRPGLDNKILAAWNGLIFSGLSEVAKAFEDEALENFIKKNADFLWINLTEKVLNHGQETAIGLWHQTSEKDRKILGFLDDYAAIIQSFLAIYSLTFEEEYLFKAESLVQYVIHNFYDPEEGLFYFTDSQAEKLIARKKEIFDNVIPSSNAIMAQNLYFLGKRLQSSTFIELAESMFLKMKELVGKDPQWLSAWAELGMIFSMRSVEVAIVGEGYKEIGKKINQIAPPNTLLFGAHQRSKLPIFKGRLADNNRTLIYICQNQTCELPISNLEIAIKKLKDECYST
jgi:uncharacterized protein